MKDAEHCHMEIIYLGTKYSRARAPTPEEVDHSREECCPIAYLGVALGPNPDGGLRLFAHTDLENGLEGNHLFYAELSHKQAAMLVEAVSALLRMQKVRGCTEGDHAD